MKMYKRDKNCGWMNMLWQNRISRILLLTGGVLLVAAAVTGFLLYQEGAIASDNMHRLLAEYKQDLTEAPAVLSGGASTQPGTAASLPSSSPQTYEGYKILGTLRIAKIEEELPILSETSSEALKVSCCYYQGALPGEKGNMVITGHDYANGAIFGKLSKLEKGDTVKLATRDAVYDYTVYETKVITPDNAAALDDYEGDMALTLMTCTSHGNRRLLVRCKTGGSSLK
jgi:sortase A